MEHDNHDNHDTNEHTPRPPDQSSGESSPNILKRFLSSLFQDRLLTATPATAPARPLSPHSQPPPQPSNNLIPFFSAASLLATPQTQEYHTQVSPRPDDTCPDFSAHQMQSAQHVVFCVEDTVDLKDDKYSVGVVDRTFGDVESHEPRPQRDYTEDIERDADIPNDAFAKFMKTGIPPRGTVLVSWQTQLRTELIQEEKIQLLDRALYVGDVVKRNSEAHMSGTVIGTRAVCTLFPATSFNGGQITQATTDDLSIRLVPAEELLNVHEFVESQLVVYGDWVGRIENVYDEVAVKLSNNSVVIVEDPNELDRDDVTVERLSVGDTVKTKKGNLRRGRWRFGAFDPNVRPEGMVVETRASEIDVQWLARSIGASNIAFSAEEPPATLGRDEFESSTFYKYDASGSTAATLPISANGIDRSYHVADVTVGDRVHFKDLPGAAVKYDGTHTLVNGDPQGRLRRIARTESLGYELNVFLVMQTHSQVTVQWQDLTVTDDVSSSLLPDPNVEDDDEVWPGEIVCSKEGRGGGNAEETWTKPAKVGVVQTVKGRDRIATVRWFKSPSIEFYGQDLLRPSTTGELLEGIDDVSLYDIYSIPALTRRRGDFVLVHPYLVQHVQTSLHVTGPDWFGEVIDLGLDGQLTVRLGAARPVVDIRVPYESVTLAYSSDMADEFLNMQELDGDSIDDSDEEDTSDFDSASFNEMWIEYENMDGDQPVGNEEDWSTEDEGEDNSDEDESMPDIEEIADVDTSKTTPESKSPITKAVSTRLLLDATCDTSPMKQDISAPVSVIPSSFEILDTPPPTSHHHLASSSASASAFMRRIAKEHKILQGSLPPGIFVRTWESRLDLLRVLMIGPNDTPYECAPFVIDFHLSSTWPQTPPEAFFHSWTNGHGPVNPNLYEDGKICLSLLGTWHTDERNESWSPAKSTLLQVLVSIMGLVLVKEPYYNEAGYDVHRSAPETKLSSSLYTERAHFRARGFIHHALTNDIAPFEQDLQYLYRSQVGDAPKLLDKAIEAAKDIIDRSASGSEEGERDGLRTISLGAVVMLKRQVEKLEALKQASV